MSITPSEISAVFYELSRLEQRHMDWLKGEGVPISAMIEPDPILHARIAMQAGFFDQVLPEEAGADAFVFLARDRDDQPADLVAWRPRAGAIARWCGRAALLGEDAVYGPRLAAEGALPIFSSPLGWLKAGRHGVVILDHHRAASFLEGLGPYQAEDEAHRAELRRLLTKPAPRILVPRRAELAMEVA